MLNDKRTALIFTANTPHVAQADLMFKSLRDAKKGNFNGDIWVISTELSIRCQDVLDSMGIKYLINPLKELFKWKAWKIIAEHTKEPGSIEERFLKYRNKRMSKLILLDWIEKFGDKYDFIALCDNDLYFQKDVNILYSKYYDKNPDKIHYWHEEYDIDNTALYAKGFYYLTHYSIDPIKFGEHEVNIGFILGSPKIMKTLWQEIKHHFYNLNPMLFAKFNWHDQDLARLVRAKNPEYFELMDEGDILHLCAGGNKLIEEKQPLNFYHTITQDKPYMVHFAGGAWKQFPSVKGYYERNADTYFFVKENTPLYDKIRQKSMLNIFQNPSYYTNNNQIRKEKARAEWILKRNNGKKKILFHGWLFVNSHKNVYDYLKPFFHSELYDIAVLDGNIFNHDYEGLIHEDIPKVIESLRRIIDNSYLVREYGYIIQDIDRSLLEDSIVSLKEEYSCTDREALAVANLIYLYLYDAIDFYNPEMVTLWGYYLPTGRILRAICKEKGIPVCAAEWTILPGTVSFDFQGHMGGCWVSQESDFFNSLSISSEDINNAKAYIMLSTNPDFSRNQLSLLSPDEMYRLEELRKSNAKTVLYIETNSAYSGNISSDPEEAKHHSRFFNNDKDAYQAVLDLARKHNWNIIYKPHPISKTKGIKAEIDFKYTTIINNGSLYECLNYADCSVTLLSQGAYISLLKGVPVVLVGQIQLNSSNAAYVMKEPNDLEGLLLDALTIGYTQEKKEYFIEHVARALKYYVYKVFPEIPTSNDLQAFSENLLKIISGTAPEHYKYESEAFLSQKRTQTIEHNEVPVISVIMPVYNSEEYLASCLSYIINQTFKDIEILCINNGSTDNSQEILEYYAQRDPRIKLFYQEEPNQRAARNLGINEAKGKYIYLTDDDYLDLDAFEKLLKTAEEKDADLLYFFFREVTANNRGRPRYYTYKNLLPEDNVYALSREYYKFFAMYPFPWAKLMRRDFVLENQLYFDNDCINFDDNPHNLRTLLAAKNPYVHNEQLYNFRIHEGSMTQSTNPRVIGMLDAVRIMNQLYIENNCYLEFQKWYVSYKVHLLAFAWGKLIDEHKEHFYKQMPTLFFESDLDYMSLDEVRSALQMPSDSAIVLIKEMLSKDYETFIGGQNKKPRLHHTPLRIRIIQKLRDIGSSVKNKSPFLYRIGRCSYRCLREVYRIFKKD